MQIFPAILTDSVASVQEQLDLAAESEDTKTVQIDIIDGQFVDNITVAPLDITTLNFHHLTCDLHLLVDEPMDYVFEAEAVKTYLPIRAVIAQIEHMSYQTSFLEEVKKQNWQAGLALDIFTPLDEVEEACWRQLDIIQLMGNEAGFQGEDLHPHLIPKIKELTQLLSEKGLKPEIYIDVGVKRDNIESLQKAGATGFAVGSGIWQAPQPVQMLNELLAL
ncbi:MAG TPA: hypothetical protein VD999_03205 [Vitreimonas sp.]|nr:hypothetical protein [Vitreimonas sp.]